MKVSAVITDIIEAAFRKALANRGVEAPRKFEDDMALLGSGLDSLGFAILVTSLEDQLGYDPFVLMEEPVYPETYREFVDIYLAQSSHLSKDVPT